MKFLVYFFIIYTTLIYSQSGWVQQSPLPTNKPLVSVKFVNDYTGFISGYWGTMLKTTNGGQLWYISNSGVGDSTLVNVDFFDENTGLVGVRNYQGTQSRILKTTNSGENWFTITLPDTNMIVNINCTSNNTAFVSGTFGTIYKTTNRGNNWTSIKIDTNKHIGNIFFINPNTGYIMGYTYFTNSYVMKTTTGGINWQYVLTDPSPMKYRTIYFCNESTGFVISNHSILKTTNSGINWQTLSYPNPFGNSLTTICFKDANSGFAAGEYGYIIMTTNGGMSWNSTNANIEDYLSSVSITNTGRVYVVGGWSKIVSSSDWGGSWINQFSGTSNTLLSIQFFNNNTGFALGNSGNTSGKQDLIKTTNGGVNWLYVDLPRSGYWAKMLFVNEMIGFLTGRNGEFLKTIDGGNNWVDYSILSINFDVIDFINENTGFITGYCSNIWKTTNGGINWIIKSDSGGTALKFVNNLTGYLGFNCGLTNKIRKTTDGAETWFNLNLNLSEIQEIKSIFFTNSDVGFICGEGFIYKTSNGGINWTLVFSGNSWTDYIYDIYFTNLMTGYAVGGYSNWSTTILKTTNSGINWINQNLNYNMQLNSVYFLNDSIGYTCGQWGIVLKTTNGGNPIGVALISNEIPNNFNLHQNHPNPFNPSTLIQYDLPENATVSLIIYDILGREISKIVNGEYQRAGSYEAEFDGSNLASGVYFYRLITDDAVLDTKKMVLIK